MAGGDFDALLDLEEGFLADGYAQGARSARGTLRLIQAHHC